MQDPLTRTDQVAEAEMNCMEVWGGNGATENHMIRPGLDVWISSSVQSCSEVCGGDLHLLSSCASGRITRMLLADICECEPPYHQIAGDFRELMKRNVNSIHQGRFEREMGRRLDEASQRGSFASTLISTYIAPTRTFTLCNAGHPPPLLYRNQSQEWSALKQVPTATSTTDVPFGVLNPGEYQRLKIKLKPGDTILSYSGVLTECRDANGRIIGLEGLLRRVRETDPRQPARLTAELLGQIREEDPDNLTSDDATLLLCRATETPVAWRDNVLAPFRLLRSVSDKTRIG